MKQSWIFKGVLVVLLLYTTLNVIEGASTNLGKSLQNVKIQKGFNASVWANDLNYPRGLRVVSNNDVLVVEAGKNRVTALWDDNKNGYSDEKERAVLAEATDLNHGIETTSTHLYASAPTKVYRWKYKAGQRKDLGKGEVVVKDIPCCHHVTRTLRIDQKKNHLYVSVGSKSNVDPNSKAARIRRFSLNSIPEEGFEWDDGLLFADGLRNEVGLRFDSKNRLWGVENGVDDLKRKDLGGDIHTDNPGEELNLFEEAGKFYGYPYCWSEYKLPKKYSKGRGAQWVHPDFMDKEPYSDNWCRNLKNVVPPKHVSQAHMAPLDVFFWTGKSFPGSYMNNAFVAFHGSWNRDSAVGYRIDYFTIEEKSNASFSIKSVPFLSYQKDSGEDEGDWLRPVALDSVKCGKSRSEDCLIFTSDQTGIIGSIAPR